MTMRAFHLGIELEIGWLRSLPAAQRAEVVEEARRDAIKTIAAELYDAQAVSCSVQTPPHDQRVIRLSFDVRVSMPRGHWITATELCERGGVVAGYESLSAPEQPPYPVAPVSRSPESDTGTVRSNSMGGRHGDAFMGIDVVARTMPPALFDPNLPAGSGYLVSGSPTLVHRVMDQPSTAEVAAHMAEPINRANATPARALADELSLVEQMRLRQVAQMIADLDPDRE